MPDDEPRRAEEVLAELPWRRIAWRRGTKGAIAAHFFAAVIEVPALRPRVAGLLGRYEALQVLIRVGRRAGQPTPPPAVRRPVREVLRKAGPA
jgi:hypothetical protein